MLFYSKSFILLFFNVFQLAFSIVEPPEIRDGGNYRIRSVGNGQSLTVIENGIVGLRTGRVSTRPYINKLSQQWTLTWKPIDFKFQGYYIESRKEFLNAITAFYAYPSTSVAKSNIWMLKYVGEGRWTIQNARSKLCLQLAENSIDVVEDVCSNLEEDESQHWNIIRLIVVPEDEDLGKRGF